MAAATEHTVLGNFDDATFTYFGVTSTFYRKDGKFFVRTDGPDGALHDYEIGYTFGVSPLQQYLIALPGGRYQALGIAWDSRPAAEGGQRWFHLYPGQGLTRATAALDGHQPDLELHVRRLPLDRICSATSTCAATAIDTTWSEIDVSCEACHGPGLAPCRLGASARKPAGDATAQGPGGALPTPARRTGSSIPANRHRGADGAAGNRTRKSRPARPAMPAAASSRTTSALGHPLLDSAVPVACSTAASITPTARSRTRSTNMARSCRARCIARA